MTTIGEAAAHPQRGLDAVARKQVVDVFTEQASLLQSIADEVRALQREASVSSGAAVDAANASRAAVRVAAEGAEQVQRLEHLVKRLDEVDTAFSRLTTVVENIHHRVAVIEDIAFESNMLAINASIEAARAGELGRGFTVVATSMRDLSRQSRRAATEIGEILENGREDIKEIDQAWHLLRNENETVAHETIARFAEVERSAADAAQAVGRIADAARCQESAAEGVAETALRAAEDQARKAAEIVGVLTGEHIVELTPREAYARIAEGARIIDVRGPDEWRGDLGHIAEATQWSIGEALERELARQDPGTWIFVCRRGGRSMRACQRALSLGLGEVFNLTGGMLAWVEAGLPVVERVH